MCGIFALLNNDNNSLNHSNNNRHIDFITTQFNKGQNRGPESSKLGHFLHLFLGFHRLAINGLNNTSNQPLIFNDVILICNGEIYNYKELYKSMNVIPTTQSDCEVIIHLYIKYGIEQTLQMLDGVFAFVLLDNRLTNDLNDKLYIARDPYGVRPLYYLKNTNNNYNMFNLYGFASELKCLSEFYHLNTLSYSIESFKPGSYSIFNLSSKVNSLWEPISENIPYVIPSFSYGLINSTIPNEDILSEIYKKISDYLTAAVHKRCLTTERPIACLLSGGLDSSLITALVNDYYIKNNMDKKLETYSIGLKGSEDLKYAKMVADYLQTNHTEIIVSEKEMFEAIPEVIYAIESYDTTTVRASIGNYLIGKYISKSSQAKVIFNGDGSDELLGGYLYMNKCPDDIEFDKETRRLLKDIHLFDVLRSDKSISSNGLEPRTPFLDRSFVNYILSIPPFFRNHQNFNKCEKFFLREAFSFPNYDSNHIQILPEKVLWRKKEAFSDGVTSKDRSLFTILQEHIAFHLNIEENTTKYTPCIETEKYYYAKLFESSFKHCKHILPYFWMPKYTNATDPSARTLEIYEQEKI